MSKIKELLGLIDRYNIPYMRDDRNGDTYLSFNKMDINLNQDESAEVTVFSLKDTQKEPIFNHYFAKLTEKDFSNLQHLLKSSIEGKLIEYNDFVWGNAVAIHEDDGSFLIPLKNKYIDPPSSINGSYIFR